MPDNSYIYTRACIQGGLPPCTFACPVNFNPRVFLSKLKKGHFDAAYREYANQVIFPGIVSRLCPQDCLSVCPENISMILLERACVSHAQKKDPVSFNLPPRKESIAIVGGGLCGLACALKLATRKYSVTVFERTADMGGSLAEKMDEAVYQEEFALQFKHLKYTLETNREISSLDDLPFDAIFLATGRGGKDFGLLEGWDKNSMATRRPGVFLGGMLSGVSEMEALMQGIIAAASIEKYLKTGDMSGQPETFRQTEPKMPVPTGTGSSSIVPANDGLYSLDEAAAEAARCIDCDCTACRDGCAFLQHMDLFPRQVESNSKMAAAAQKGLFERVGTRMIVSCSVCGHCGSVCPEKINVEDILIKAKKQLFEDGCFAPALHDFYLRDMSRALDEAYLAQAAPGYETATYLFFPGCQMTASGTEHVEKAYRYMLDKKPDTALLMGCCGVPALWAGDHNLYNRVLNQLKEDWQRLGKPTLVTSCPSCAKTFRNYAPELECISLYEFIYANGLPQDTFALEGQWAVFDPCSSRDFPTMQDSVRSLALKLGATLAELPASRQQARCCGMGGHIYPANPNIFHKMLAMATGQSELPYITYCTNCRNLFLSDGKPCRHILDDLFGIEPLSKPFHISELKKNRLNLKKSMLKNIWGEQWSMKEKKYTVMLRIPENVYDKMDTLHISEEDVYEVVEYCEQTNETVTDRETGILSGHLRIGIITYWVQYKKKKDCIEVVNAYCHRLKVT